MSVTACVTYRLFTLCKFYKQPPCHFFSNWNRKLKSWIYMESVYMDLTFIGLLFALHNHDRALQPTCVTQLPVLLLKSTWLFPIISCFSVHGLLDVICLHKYLNMIWESLAGQNLDASTVWFGLIEIKNFNKIIQWAFLFAMSMLVLLKTLNISLLHLTFSKIILSYNKCETVPINGKTK